MSEKQQDNTQEPKEKDPKPAEALTTGEGTQEPGPIPYERFKEINDRAKRLDEQVKNLEKKEREREEADEKKRQERLKEQEKFQELAEEWESKFKNLQPQHDAAQHELNTVRELLGRYADAQMESIPDLFRDVVAKLPLLERLEWLTENSEKLVAKKPGGIPATPSGRAVGDLKEDERRQRSARTF